MAASLFFLAMFLSACDPGPIDGVLVGTWEITFPYGVDATTLMTFYADHTMVSFGDSIMGRNKIYSRGRWTADERQICIEEEGDRPETVCWPLVRMQRNKLRFHFSGRDYDHVWTRRRLMPPQASNHTMERTAASRTI